MFRLLNVNIYTGRYSKQKQWAESRRTAFVQIRCKISNGKLSRADGDGPEASGLQI